MCVEERSSQSVLPIGPAPEAKEAWDELAFRFKEMCEPFRPKNRVIFFSRHGESEYNVDDRIGGNPHLTMRGHKYAMTLGKWMEGQQLENVQLWTSGLIRTHETAHFVPCQKHKIWPQLNELESGIFDGLTYSEVKTNHPEDYERRSNDKWGYRYPKGESYLDCCHRVLPVIQAIFQETEPLLVVSHQAILRCVFGLLLGVGPDRIPFIKVPQHAVTKATFDSEGNCNLETIYMPVFHFEAGMNEFSMVESGQQPISAPTR